MQELGLHVGHRAPPALGTDDWTQGLINAGQVLCHWAASASSNEFYFERESH